SGADVESVGVSQTIDRTNNRQNKYQNQAVHYSDQALNASRIMLICNWMVQEDPVPKQTK
ncbi:MAG: hypothetical protein ACOYNR_07530, partial [Blastocatellia bacterium]